MVHYAEDEGHWFLRVQSNRNFTDNISHFVVEGKGSVVGILRQIKHKSTCGNEIKVRKGRQNLPDLDEGDI